MSSALNISVTDQSPAWIYTPDREGISTSSWQSAWSGTPDSSYDPTHTQNNIPQGISSHFTTLAGASVQINFIGTAITLYGQGTAGAYTTTLDGGQAISGNPSGSILATYGGLNDTTKHSLLLQVTQSQTLSLSNATFTIRTGIPASEIVNTTQTAVAVGPNNTDTTNSFFTTSGSGFSNQHVDDGYTRIDTDSAGATTSFTCTNTSALFVYGTTNWNHQTFSFEIDPSAGVSQGARIFNGTSKWFVLDNLVFFEAGMDPTQTYQVKMTNLIDGSYSDIHSVVMMNLPPESSAASGSPTSGGSTSKSTSTSATDTASSKPSSTGKTVGIAVGAIAAVAVVIIFAALCWRRRSRNARKFSRSSLDEMAVTPFGNHARTGSTLPSQSETPMSLSQFGGPSGLHEPYSNHGQQYSTSSAVASVQDLRDHAMGITSGRYSLVATDDYNPYSEPGIPRPNFVESASVFASGAGSSFGTLARPSSGPPSQAGPYIGKPEKGPAPAEAASASSSRLPRQEVDAGRVPVDPEEETLPPNYDPSWAN